MKNTKKYLAVLLAAVLLLACLPMTGLFVGAAEVEGCEEHTPGDWIVDIPATAVSEGSRHKECEVCGFVTQTEVIPVLGEPGLQDSLIALLEIIKNFAKLIVIIVIFFQQIKTLT